MIDEHAHITEAQYQLFVDCQDQLHLNIDYLQFMRTWPNYEHETTRQNAIKVCQRSIEQLGQVVKLLEANGETQ